MMAKFCLLLIGTLLLSTLVISQQQNDVIKLVPYKALPGVSAMAPAPVPGGDCSGYLVCYLYLSKRSSNHK